MQFTKLLQSRLVALRLDDGWGSSDSFLNLCRQGADPAVPVAGGNALKVKVVLGAKLDGELTGRAALDDFGGLVLRIVRCNSM